ncbi:DinB family protein [Elizabethkingia sp. JS20170427COW]|uniref:DinB family protein n=1 Tax=Elizabethkingia sp. JS20170427COW TaxID=2583851 RepID=UPI0011102283|nr:DinB family protein [Elizabethkingia sp. JS20170427COW]QCX53867.1 DinB family protein [Elizabethkingia sp. JS20170427COW]
MKKSQIPNYLQLNDYFQYYINLLEDIEIDQALKDSLQSIEELEVTQLAELRDYTYAEGKWTVRQLLLHLIDTERIFAARITRLARKDTLISPGFDEVLFNQNARYQHRTVQDLIEELVSVRKATMAMFKGFDEGTLLFEGEITTGEISVVGLGFMLLGHQKHHLRILEERYLKH